MSQPPTSEALARHESACQNGENLYEDPVTGNYVMTSFYLRNRAYCCGNGCRHCPWPLAAQIEAGRPDTPAYPYPSDDSA